MKFVVTATIASLALASLGYAVTAADPAPNSLVQRWWTAVDSGVEENSGVETELKSREETHMLVKRDAGGLYICPELDWKPQSGLGCSHYIFPRPGCIAVDRETYRFRISSIGPDQGTWCIIYSSTNCSDGSPKFTLPGFGRLEGDTWGQYKDNTGSIKCWW